MSHDNSEDKPTLAFFARAVPFQATVLRDADSDTLSWSSAHTELLVRVYKGQCPGTPCIPHDGELSVRVVKREWCYHVVSGVGQMPCL